MGVLDPSVSTKNLVELAPVAPDDVERVRAWLSDSEIFDFSVGRYTYGDPAVVGHDFPRTQAVSAFGTAAPIVLPHGPEECVAYSVRTIGTHEHIGEAHIAMDTGLNAQISFLIGPRAYWHRVYGVATALALVDYAFAVRRLKRVWADVPEFNKDALTYLARLGLRESAALRNSRMHARARFRSVVMGMLLSEYGVRFPAGLTANEIQEIVLMPW